MLRHILQIKGQVIAPFPSYHQEKSIVFGRPLWVLEAAYSSLGSAVMTHLLVDIQGASFEWWLD